MRFAECLRCFAAAAAASLLGGCIAQVPDDVTFVSVEAVDWHDEAELPGHGPEKQHRLMLKTTFATTMDLVQFAEKHSYSLGADASFCDDPERREGIAYSAIYWQGIRIDRYDRSVTELRWSSENDAIFYYAYLVQDLSKHPKDICLYVSGGSMAGFGYKSNSVVVPASEIEAALRDLPPAFR